MRVSRIGFTPLKGTQHSAVDEATLALSGPVGDRVFCLVDTRRRRVLRTVENPRLVQVRSAWDGTTLTVTLPGGATVAGTPCDDGGTLDADYWGRTATLTLQSGPHAELLSDHLGSRVRLARAAPGEVVYGGSVSIVTTGALRDLAARAGDGRLARQDARFRATLTLDTEIDLDALPLGAWIRVGAACVALGAPLPRCAVVDLDPETGRQTSAVLRTLAGYRRTSGEIRFGLDARVVVPGRVRPGDPADMEV